MKNWILILLSIAAFSGSATAQFRHEAPAPLQSPALEPSPAGVVRDGLPAFDNYAPPDSGILKTVHDVFSDDPNYYGKAPWYIPVLKITASNVALWLVDRFVLNYDFAKVTPATWAWNFQRGFGWEDSDRFGNDFFFHPYTGGGYFMDARSLGYDFWESIPFALFGSAEWKYFAENDRPSWGDLINTTVNGAFTGEVAYRLSSNVLDDSKTGPERAWREAAGALLSPSRFFSRLIDGKLWKVSDQPTLGKAPMDIRLGVGAVKVNEANQFNTGPIKADFNLAMEYGDPFTTEDTRPFNHFTLAFEFTNAYERKLLGGVKGYGMLTGMHEQLGPFKSTLGIFQHFNYNDNTAYELGDVAIGAGILTKLPVTEYHNLYSNWLVSLVPFAGNNESRTPIDTTQQRDYNYDYGFMAMTETGFALGNKALDIGITAYYYYIHSFYGAPGNNEIALIKPRIAVNIWKNLGIGFEHQIFISNRTSPSLDPFSITRTEQRLYVQWVWDDFPKE